MTYPPGKVWSRSKSRQSSMPVLQKVPLPLVTFRAGLRNEAVTKLICNGFVLQTKVVRGEIVLLSSAVYTSDEWLEGLQDLNIKPRPPTAKESTVIPEQQSEKASFPPQRLWDNAEEMVQFVVSDDMQDVAGSCYQGSQLLRAESHFGVWT